MFDHIQQTSEHDQEEEREIIGSVLIEVRFFYTFLFPVFSIHYYYYYVDNIRYRNNSRGKQKMKCRSSPIPNWPDISNQVGGDNKYTVQRHMH